MGNTLILQAILFVVSVLGSQSFTLHIPLIIILRLIYFPMPIVITSEESLKRAATLVPFHNVTWKNSLALSKPRHCLWWQSQENQENTALYIISCIHTYLLPSHPSIQLLIQTLTPVHMAPSLPFASPYLAYLQDPKHLSETWQKHTKPSLSVQINGQVLWCASKERINLRLTQTTILASLLRGVSTAKLQMRVLIFSEPTALAHCQSGSTTTYSSAYHITITATMTAILMKYHLALGFNGKNQKQFHLDPWSHISVLNGTLSTAPLPFPPGKGRNTLRLSKSGKVPQLTPFSMFNSFTENYFISPWWFPQAGPTSLAWNPCSAPSVTVLSCHIPHPEKHQAISNGGSSFCNPNQFCNPSRNQQTSSSTSHTWTPALVLALLSQLAISGGHGNWSQDGNQMGETLDGQRLLGSSYSLDTSSGVPKQAPTSRSMEITWALLKGGGMAAAGTNTQMSYSAKSPNYPVSMTAFRCYEGQRPLGKRCFSCVLEETCSDLG
ncbi:hypothetical protein B0H34DRAFT_831819, partial [Crassisporium funariophilum]